ncbi:MAG: HAD family hydrolase [Armatimonadota bacterium]
MQALWRKERDFRYMKLVGITTLVFDFDGTLATCPYDFAYMRRSVLQAVLEHGLDPDALANLGLLEIIHAGAELLGEDQLKSAAFREEATNRLTAIEVEAAEHTYLLPGIVEALQQLRAAGYRLGIVTRNSTAAVAHIIGDTPLPFDAMLCREDVQRPKPHPEHVMQMLHLLGSNPEMSLMVGDHPMDIEMGKAAGMGTVAVLTGQSHQEALEAVKPDLLLPSVLELSAMLLNGDRG